MSDAATKGFTVQVLVVERPDTLELLNLLLSSAGVAVELATSIEEATRKLAQTSPDLVLSDLRLWGTPPTALLDLLDGDGRAKHIPVLFVTGDVEQTTEPAAWHHRPCTEALVKPFDIDYLLACVVRLAHQGQQQQCVSPDRSH